MSGKMGRQRDGVPITVFKPYSLVTAKDNYTSQLCEKINSFNFFKKKKDCTMWSFPPLSLGLKVTFLTKK